MDDFAIILCCLNNQRIYCLEYTCLIISIMIFPCNFLGLIVIHWNLVHFYCEIIYSINITLALFSIFIISIIIYSTKVGKLISSELNNSFVFLTIMTLILSIYSFITYGLSSFEIFRGYLTFYQQQRYELSPSMEDRVIVKKMNSKITWILISLSSLLPSILSSINIFIWISIYLRISNRIYCSYNKEIRNEFRKQKKINKEFKEFQDNKENSDINESQRDKNKYQKDLISIVIEKDRHPGISRTSNTKNISSSSTNNYQTKTKNQLHRMRKKTNDDEINKIKKIDLDNVSSERKLNKNNIIIPKIE